MNCDEMHQYFELFKMIRIEGSLILILIKKNDDYLIDIKTE